MPNGKFRIAQIYGFGAAMGFTPQEIDRMSYWQFMAAVSGYVKANSSGGGSLSETEKDDLFNWIESSTESGRTLRTQTYWWGEEPWPVPMGEVEFEVE